MDNPLTWADMNRLTALAFLVASLAILAACSDSKIVLQGPSGGKKLVYDPANFRPQVENSEDIGILVRAAGETLTNAAGNQSYVTVQEITEAMDAGDWRKLEVLVVNYRAAHR